MASNGINDDGFPARPITKRRPPANTPPLKPPPLAKPPPGADIVALRERVERAPRRNPLTRSPAKYGEKRSKELEEIFLAWLRKGYTIKTASEQTGIGRRTAVFWYNSPRPSWRPEGTTSFAEDWDLALAEGTDKLEDECWRRAVDGYDEPIFFSGRQVGVVKRYSDTLLTVLLRGRRPEVYARGNNDNGARASREPVAVNIVTMPQEHYLTAEQIATAVAGVIVKREAEQAQEQLRRALARDDSPCPGSESETDDNDDDGSSRR